MKRFLLTLLIISTIYAQDDAYTQAAKSLDWNQVKTDIRAALTNSTSFWPADNGNYGPFTIRLAWHCSGSYRIFDGRGGCDGGRIRFTPESSWADNANLDKARMVLEPIKQKYGLGLSYGDLYILTGTTAIEMLGGPILGFCGGRVDDADGSDSFYLGPTTQQTSLFPCQTQGDCKSPLGPTTIGLIYVNPEGPQGNPDPSGSAPQVRDTFARMGMNDSETVALIGGGHSFGKTHGACPSPPCGSGPTAGIGANAYTSGFEGGWTLNQDTWGNDYFANLLTNNYSVFIGPGGKHQWRVTDNSTSVVMLTADISLKNDSTYLTAAQGYLSSLSDLSNAFSHAWYKLVSRDMGPVTRCLGPFVPPAQPFQYPLPPAPTSFPDWNSVKQDLAPLIASNASELVQLAFLCATSFRKTDYSGGCNGARIRFPPQSQWAGHSGVSQILALLTSIQSKYTNLSWGDLIVYAGTLALGDTQLTFCPGRTDAQDGIGLEYVQPKNFWNATIPLMRYDELLLGLNDTEYVALYARLPSATLQAQNGLEGTWSTTPNVLSNQYFTTLKAETWTSYNVSGSGLTQYKASGKNLYITVNDYNLLSDTGYMAVVTTFAGDNNAFLNNFRAVWTKIMNIDRYDGPTGNVCWNTSIPLSGSTTSSSSSGGSSNSGSTSSSGSKTSSGGSSSTGSSSSSSSSGSSSSTPSSSSSNANIFVLSLLFFFVFILI